MQVIMREGTNMDAIMHWCSNVTVGVLGSEDGRDSSARRVGGTHFTGGRAKWGLSSDARGVCL